MIETDKYPRLSGSSISNNGHGSRWQKESKMFLQHHPLCIECRKKGLFVKAMMVGNIFMHQGDPDLFWDHSNWQPLCMQHYNELLEREG